MRDLWDATAALKDLEADMAWHRWWVKEMTQQAERWWDSPVIYGLYQETIQFSEEMIQLDKQKILKIARGDRWVF